MYILRVCIPGRAQARITAGCFFTALNNTGGAVQISVPFNDRMAPALPMCTPSRRPCVGQSSGMHLYRIRGKFITRGQYLTYRNQQREKRRSHRCLDTAVATEAPGTLLSAACEAAQGSHAAHNTVPVQEIVAPSTDSQATPKAEPERPQCLTDVQNATKASMGGAIRNPAVSSILPPVASVGALQPGDKPGEGISIPYREVDGVYVCRMPRPAIPAADVSAPQQHASPVTPADSGSSDGDTTLEDIEDAHACATDTADSSMLQPGTAANACSPGAPVATSEGVAHTASAVAAALSAVQHYSVMAARQNGAGGSAVNCEAALNTADDTAKRGAQTEDMMAKATPAAGAAAAAAAHYVSAAGNNAAASVAAVKAVRLGSLQCKANERRISVPPPKLIHIAPQPWQLLDGATGTTAGAHSPSIHCLLLY